MNRFCTALFLFHRVKKLRTAAYRQRTCGEAERYNRFTVARQHHYVSKSQPDLNTYVQPLRYVYNSTRPCTTGAILFNVIFRREPPSNATTVRLAGNTSSMPRDARSQHTYHRELECVVLMKPKVGRLMVATKKGYRKDYDRTFARNLKYVLEMDYSLNISSMPHSCTIQARSFLRERTAK